MAAMRMFEPGTIGSLRVKNRLVMPAMATNFASAHGEPTPRLTGYYAARARGGVGLIVVENASVNEPAGGNGAVQLRISHDRYIPGLSALAGRIKEEGAAVAIQINHAGAIADPGRTGVPAVGPSDVGWTRMSPRPRALAPEEIEQLIERYAEAAVRAQRGGFDAVEIHGAHGYLIAQFLSPLTNRRTDAYGGSTENRWRFATRVVRAVREGVGLDYPILFRLSGDEFMPGGRSLAESVEMAPSLVEAGIDALHVSAGTSANPEVQLEPASYSEAWRAHLAAALKPRVTVPVITVGVFRHPETVERVLTEGGADFVALGRGLIADPEWPNKARTGDDAGIRHCVSCNRCVRHRVFDDLPIRCSVNPAVGFEGEVGVAPSKPRQIPLRVLVIGGGPAGLQAAATASEPGVEVTLFEREASLGGALRVAALPPYKEKLAWLMEDLVHALPASVDLRLGSAASVGDVKTLRPDVVILATGAIPVALDVPTSPQACVQTAESLLTSSDDLVGTAVAVVGAGMVGCETALACARRGARTTLVEVLSEVGRDCEPISRSVLLLHLEEQEVRILCQVRVKEIVPGVVVIDNGRGEMRIPADRVVTAIGAVADDRLARPLVESGHRVLRIGDARRPRDIADAIYEGWRAGRWAATGFCEPATMEEGRWNA
jgi:2,4-dienoyl-CoA reductase-like NADH-dependent reductase (Old Yellow Enzyme family)/thioredoxin reductase